MTVRFASPVLGSGISIKSVDNQIAVKIGTDVLFSNDPKVQQDVKLLVNAAFSNLTLPGMVNLNNLRFGYDSSEANTIDTFSEIELASDINTLYQKGVKDSFTLPTIYDLLPKSFDLDVHDQNTLLSNWVIGLTKQLPIPMDIKLPYMELGTLCDGSEFMNLYFTAFHLYDNKIEGSVLVHFPNDPVVNQALVGNVADILFHRAASIVYNNTLTVQNLKFGPFSDGAITFLDTVSGSVAINRYINEAAAYFDKNTPVDFEDIDAHLTVPGLDVNCLIKPPPFPIHVKLDHIEIDIGWQVDGVGFVYGGLGIVLDSINLPSFRVKATPDLNPDTGGVHALEDLLMNMFQFKEFLGNARFRNLKLIGSNGVVFMPYYTTFFKAPPSFSIPPPLYVELLPYQIPLRIALSVRNPASLHLDLGRAQINVTDADSGKVFVSADTTNDVVALNVREGGNGTAEKAPTIALLTVPVFNIGGILLDLPKLVLRLLRKSEKATFAIDVLLTRNGQEIKWVTFATHYLFEHGLLKKFQPLLGTILAHLKISIGGGGDLLFPLHNSTLGRSSNSTNSTQPVGPPRSLMETNEEVRKAVSDYWASVGSRDGFLVKGLDGPIVV